MTELAIAGAFWGFGFIATVWTLPFLSASAIIFYRFAAAFVVGSIFVLMAKPSPESMKHHFKLALLPGIFLFLTLIFQTWGLRTTTATNSSFITTLYVILIPVIRGVIGHEKITGRIWLAVLLALVGTALIVQVQNISSVNWGDFLTLICAVAAALHIIVMGKVAPKSSNDFATNVFQSAWVCVLCVFIIPFESQWSLSSLDLRGWIGLASLAFGSSLIGFYLQVRAQKEVSPSVAGIMFLLESPFACVFAFFFFGELFNAWQWLGAILILLACLSITFLKPKELKTA